MPLNNQENQYQVNFPLFKWSISLWNSKCFYDLLIELEAATSTTQSESPAHRISSTEPAEWTIEDVIHYIGITDPALGQHADLFRKHVSFFLFFY